MDSIRVVGARTHNLKNINVEIPRNKLTVITGLSGSGKSSLAFDTLYAEGQRRYVESLSTYARQFLQSTDKPDVDKIEGLSPAISIDQKTAPRNPRSTVGTVTEIYDYLRLLFAKIGHPNCPHCQQPIQRQSISQIIEAIAQYPREQKILILSPVISGKKGEHLHIFEKIKKDGFVRLRIDGQIYTIAERFDLDPNQKHTIEIVVDRLVCKDFIKTYKTLSSGEKIELPNPARTRLASSIETALKYGNGVLTIYNQDAETEAIFSENYACPHCGLSLPPIEPRSFSFNSPYGACPACHGLGTKLEIDPTLVIPNPTLSLAEGAILPWANTSSQLSWFNRILAVVAKKHRFSLETAWEKLQPRIQQLLLYGSGEKKYSVQMNGESFNGSYATRFEGVIPYLERRYKETDSEYAQTKIERFMQITECPVCHGKRLKPEILAVKINDQSIIAVTEMPILKLKEFLGNLTLSENESLIAKTILKEALERLDFLVNVGLDYLSLERRANTLSGGEAQRIRLATQIGSKLQGVLYVLDEPSIGLHQNDNSRLIKTLYGLRDLGNTVIVVEHDEDTMLSADWLIDIGPGAGNQGGEVVAVGTPEAIKNNSASLTGQYLAHQKTISLPSNRRRGNGKFLEIKEASEHNLKNINVKIPLGKLVAVTGVSGSGKSSLINDTLVPILTVKLNRAHATTGKYREIRGLEHLDKILNIDQSPIGRTPRSNPATYTGVFGEIRKLFAKTAEARIRGYKAGRFSFNVKGGRCEDCQGDGLKKIEMQFLPDIYVPCETCKGKRYNQEALEITYRGKNIAEVLDLTVNEAYEFFHSIPMIEKKLKVLAEVGLGYIHLGQPATTLSGGEAQRIKLSTELSKHSTGKTFYVLDEPTTGLHFDDVKKLLEVLNKLVDAGNTVVIIEHNLDVIKSADWVIDLGPEGGERGGEVIAEGTPEQITQVAKSYTGQWLKKMLKASI
ncbi:excinuclease ABC subunit UvrA [Candidatus Peregrinibacteria bacterium CG08_land_8_20_14_0_20_41_10]|nr:MAG: excinuclease ABC subunit UvrA [Candidatus Peregrinibacteria bacterium CG08_land_8_20_14_0_20_41_10]PJA08676.1 MAG: excinuclease ABC subunit UvrA [Candidatus Falkowbacteria bacterium CG_4_10_14_0_2_um_filter_48_10]